MNEDRQMHQKHTSVYKNCSTSYAPRISKYQNTNSKYLFCRYTQNIKIQTHNTFCADAPKILKYQLKLLIVQIHPKYQNINSSCSLCRYTQNIEVPHCADAPDRAAHQRLLRLRPRCLGQRRRLWSHKVFLFNCFVFLFACLDLFRRSNGFVMKFASTILH